MGFASPPNEGTRTYGILCLTLEFSGTTQEMSLMCLCVSSWVCLKGFNHIKDLIKRPSTFLINRTNGSKAYLTINISAINLMWWTKSETHGLKLYRHLNVCINTKCKIYLKLIFLIFQSRRFCGRRTCLRYGVQKANVHLQPKTRDY